MKKSLRLMQDNGVQGDNITNDARIEGLDVNPANGIITYTLTLNGKVAGKANSLLPKDINASVMEKLKNPGNYVLTVKQGNITETLSFTLDNKAPVGVKLSLAADTGFKPKDGITNDATVNVSGLEAGATLAWRENANAKWQTVAAELVQPSGDGKFATVNFASLIGNGFQGQLEVRQVDLAGNAQKGGAKLKLTYDNTAPVIAKVTPPATDSILNGGTAVIRVISSEPLVGLTKEDFVVSDAALASIKGVKQVKLAEGQFAYDVTVTASKQGGGAVSVSFATHAKAQDIAGNEADFGAFRGEPLAGFWIGNGGLSVRLVADIGVSNKDGVTNNGLIDIKGVRPNAEVEFRLKAKSQSDDQGSGWKTLEPDFTETAQGIQVNVAALYAALGIELDDAPFSGWNDTFEFRQLDSAGTASYPVSALTLTYDDYVDLFWGKPPENDELAHGQTAVLQFSSDEKLYGFDLKDLVISNAGLLSFVGIKEQAIKEEGETFWNYNVTVKATSTKSLEGEVKVDFAADALIIDLAGNQVDLSEMGTYSLFIG